jgi:hypothetical protein
MSLQNSPILGLSLGTSHIGVAVIKDARLLHWQVRKFKGAWSAKRPEQIMSFIAQLVRQHEIHAIAVKLPTRGYLSAGLVQIIAELGMYASITNLHVQAYRIHDLKQFFAKTSLNKKQMMHAVCERFPFLERTYQKELANKKAYHVKMFEAILAAIRLQADQEREIDSDIITSILHN